MHLFVLTGSVAVMAAFATAGLARADNCVDTRQNNPAFTSPYGAADKPCPVVRVMQGEVAAKPPKPVARPVPRTAEASIPARDQPIVTSIPGGGTLIKSGDTTVCVRGSITVDVATGRGRLRPPAGAHDRDQSCD